MAKKQRPPKQRSTGSIFVGASERWWLNASINWMPSTYRAMDLYATGYLQAAQHLGRGLMRPGRSFRQLSLDCCIYPFVFLWRHYLELRLKELLMTLSALHDQSTPALTSHDLGTLWGRLRPLMERSAVPIADLRRADRVFRDFAKVDPTSQAFRYQEDKKGSPSASGVTQVNVPRVNAAMKDIAELLEGVSIGASVELRQKAEIEAWYE